MNPFHEELRRRHRRRRHGGRQLRAGTARARSCACCSSKASRPDSARQPSFDERTTALGNGSRQIFESLGVWNAMARRVRRHPLHPCVRRRALRRGAARGAGAGRRRLRLRGAQSRHRPRALAGAARRAEHHAGGARRSSSARTCATTAWSSDLQVDGEPGTAHAAVAVAADGAGSVLRASAGIEAGVEDYDQVAIVVNAATERPNTGEAFERFTPSGPLAVLPVAAVAVTPWSGPCNPTRAANCWRSTTTAFASRAAVRLWLARRPLEPDRQAQHLSTQPVARAGDRVRGASCSSAMPRRRCIRWPGRGSTWACAMRPRWRRCWPGAAGERRTAAPSC